MVSKLLGLICNNTNNLKMIKKSLMTSHVSFD